MRILLTILLLVSLNAKAASWYVDNTASGAGNGTSWTDAWTSSGAIVWASVSAGDTVNFSGGAGGKTYSGFTVNANGTSGSRITIRTGQDSGHTGMVTISGTLNAQKNYITIDGEVSGNRRWKMAAGSYIEMSYVPHPRVRYVEVSDVNLAIAMIGNVGGEVAYCKLTGIREHCAIRTTGRNFAAEGGTASYNQFFIHHNEIQVNKLAGSGTGPDGLQLGRGMTITNNLIYAVTGTIVGAEHQDLIQSYGSGGYHIVANNMFWDGSDSMIGNDSSGSNWRIYNNLFFLTGVNGTTALRWYNNATYSNIDIANNTFVDMALQTSYGAAIQLTSSSASAQPVSNVNIRNNIFYNCGRVYSVIQLTRLTGVNVSYNLMNAGALGNTTVSGASNVNGQSGVPDFVVYTQGGGTNNDLHLESVDTAANGNATNLSYLFTDDFDSITRTVPWAIGAYQSPGTGPSTNPVVSLAPSTLDFGFVKVGNTATQTVVVENIGDGTLTGSASTAAPFSITGNDDYALVNGATTNILVVYTPTTPGVQSGTVSFTGGGNATANVSGVSYTNQTGYHWVARGGTLNGYTITGNYINQSSEYSQVPNVFALYGFEIVTNGTYYFQANVRATNSGTDSLFFDINSIPNTPSNIWDVIPVTTGFEDRRIGARGSGTFDNPSYPTNFYYLTAGEYKMFFYAREPNLSISNISVLGWSTNSGTPPAIIIQPPSEFRVLEQGSTNFSVTVEGTLPVNYQWKHYDTNVVGGGFSARTVVLDPIRPANDGPYYCVITNLYGTTTSAVCYVTVVLAPEVNQNPLTTNIFWGNSLILTGNIVNAASLSWYRNGQLYASDTNRIVKPAYRIDTGLWVLQGRNEDGETNTAAARVYVIQSSNLVANTVSAGTATVGQQ